MRKIKLSHWQHAVRSDKHRYKVINCGRRAGKTYLVSLELLEKATAKEKQNIWYIAPTYKQAKAIMWQMLKELIPEAAVKKWNETELVCELINSSRIELKGADNPDSLRGVKIDFAAFDEVAFIKDWENVYKVIRPTLIDSKASVWFISTPNGYNHFYDLSQQPSVNDEYAYFHFTTYDNPNLDPKEIEAMRLEMDEDSFAQEIMGEFRRMVGIIYKEFDRNIHMVTVPQLDTSYTFTRSLDFGFAHKTALIYFAISPDGKAVYGYDGLYQSGYTVPMIGDVARTKDAGRLITNPVADSAQPAMIEELNQMGVHFNGVDKSTDSVKNGIAKVAELLRVRADTGKPTLMFDKSLDWIAVELENYRWMQHRDGLNTKEVPLKRDDDAADAIRYFAVSYKTPEVIDMSWMTNRLKRQSRDSW